MAQEKLPDKELTGVTGGGHGSGFRGIDDGGYLWTCNQVDFQEFQKQFKAILFNTCGKFENATLTFPGGNCKHCSHVNKLEK